MRILKSTTILLGLLTCTACASKPPQPTTVSGQVFVVTKSRDNIKLALVQVAAIPEKDMLEHLKKAHENGSEKQRLLMPKLEAAEKDFKAAEHESKSADAAFSANALGKGKLEASFQARDRASAKASTFLKLKDEFAYFDSPAFYLEGLPAATSASKTDADGKFAISVPSGKYVIAALTSRSVFKDTEQYYWLVKIDASTPNIFVMLSNDNFVDTKCKECLLIPTIQ